MRQLLDQLHLLDPLEDRLGALRLPGVVVGVGHVHQAPRLELDALDEALLRLELTLLARVGLGLRKANRRPASCSSATAV